MTEATNSLSRNPLADNGCSISYRRSEHFQFTTRQHKANSIMTDTSSTTINRTLPRRLPNSAYRVREYLTEKEVDRLIDAARKRGRNGPEMQRRSSWPTGMDYGLANSVP
jgi:hypothetical protein